MGVLPNKYEHLPFMRLFLTTGGDYDTFAAGEHEFFKKWKHI